MISRLRHAREEEDGFTLVELMVAAAMGVIVMGAVVTLLISAMRSQPKISGEAQNVSSARWVLARMTREIRNGIGVDPGKATASSVSFEAYVRHDTCGGSGTLPDSSPAIPCQVTYTCTTSACFRTEAAPGVFTGTQTKIFEGIDSSEVFAYSPSAAEPTYVKATLRLPDPSGTGALTVSSGASLRNATLGY